MASPRRLAWRDTSVWYLEQVVSDMWDDCSDLVDPFIFPDLTTRVPLVLYLSQEQWTTLYSAVMTGADLTYPDTSHEVEYLFLQSVICAMNEFCAAMINCLENNAATQAALIDLLSENGLTGGVGDPSAPLGDDILQEDLLPSGYACTDDKAFGMAYAIVDAINSATTEVLEAIEVLTNPVELAAELGDNIPGVGALSSAGDIARWIQDTAKEEYDLAWSVTVRDELACAIWCALLETCELSFDDVWNIYLDKSTAAPPAGVLLTDWLVWLIGLPFVGATSTVATISLLGLLAMRYGGSFGDFSLGIRSLETVINLAQDDSSPDWATVCDACVYSWCVNVVPGETNIIFTMVQPGMYYDATGWHGDNPGQNDFCRLLVDIIDPLYTQFRIEVDFTSNGDRQYQSPNGPEFQLTGTYGGNFEYPAGLQTHTIVSALTGTFTIYVGDYGTIHEIRIYGEGTNPFSSPVC